MNFNEEINCGKPVLVDFYASWCPPCRRMEPVIAELAKEHKVVKINIDDNLELSSSYDIGAVPTFIVFKNGQESQRLVGLQKKESLLEALR